MPKHWTIRESSASASSTLRVTPPEQAEECSFCRRSHSQGRRGGACRCPSTTLSERAQQGLSSSSNASSHTDQAEHGSLQALVLRPAAALEHVREHGEGLSHRELQQSRLTLSEAACRHRHTQGWVPERCAEMQRSSMSTDEH